MVGNTNFMKWLEMDGKDWKCIKPSGPVANTWKCLEMAGKG